MHMSNYRNFAKFLCDSNGIPIKRFAPNENPLSFEEDIVSLLAAVQPTAEEVETQRSPQGEL